MRSRRSTAMGHVPDPACTSRRGHSVVEAPARLLIGVRSDLSCIARVWSASPVVRVTLPGLLRTRGGDQSPLCEAGHEGLGCWVESSFLLFVRCSGPWLRLMASGGAR